jgi:hypothetical protein
LDRRREAILKWERQATPERIRLARFRQVVGLDLDRWPPPDRANIRLAEREAMSAPSATSIQFRDLAAEIGLDTRFISGFPEDGIDFYPHQVNGGGLAVLDYDLDGRCDLYLAQSGGDPQQVNGSTPNQLYRQLPDGRVSEVGAVSGGDDRGFGQGVCAGDVNQDGLPDLLVANIGINTLLLNQGDGTFRDASDWIADQAARWTSSFGLADLDGDHLPDLVEINYIDDPAVFRTLCHEHYASCKPQQFQKADDRILRGMGDGRFEVWIDGESERRPKPKLGFGLVIANFDRQAGNDFFVSNDGDLNFYWHSTPAEAGDDGPDETGDHNASTSRPYELLESAGIRGCSVGRDGDSQACMGIAWGDFNRDGLMDLHVTNFYNESSNLFMQSPPGFFSDQPVRYGVFESSVPVLGFGTQAADFDHDGWLDLAVNNGHVFNASKQGIPFRMRPQLLRGGRQGFREQAAAEGGEYWLREKVGRTVALLDWDRDGKLDLLTNHLDAPVALLRNETRAQNWLQLELIGTRSERDAIGAEVHVQAGDARWTGWQTGGDGYMCSNESLVHFGLGDVEQLDRVEVRWPGGQVQVFEDLAANRRYLVVESQPIGRRD